ncbi:hypothetical protein AB6A40_002776 [Gnathostoma spinigerum]|uniref:Post-GPI attachment to proteins factor 3 n=1 Tax=Gnathostoma spinigerum TaxID=75299 RepID=A0ABD6EHA9_9BILA
MLLILLFVFLLKHQVSCSVGDRYIIFSNCISDCTTQFDCPASPFDSGWYFDECFRCRYSCMWKTVDFINKHFNITPQFYGKWPFIGFQLPLFGFRVPVQEPASVLFSIMNLFASCYMLQAIRKFPSSCRMKDIWIGYGIIGIIVWICSSVFHCADFWQTEYFDYFSAFALIIYTFFAATVFVFPRIRACRIRATSVVFLFGSMLCAFFIRHVTSLWYDFDYGYNMRCCATFSLLTMLLYVFWMTREYRQRLGDERDSLRYMRNMLLSGFAGLVFELFDFPPILWILDAHALFHLVTVPMPFWMVKLAKSELIYDQRRAGYLKHHEP